MHDDREYDALATERGRGTATAEREDANANAERVAHGARAALRILAPTGADEATLREIAARAGVAVDMLRPDASVLPAPPRPVPAATVAPVTKPKVTDTGPSRATRGAMRQNATVAADVSQLALLMQPPQTRGEGGPPLTESFASAMRSLNANKMRAMLTMLGIIIGVSSVVIQLAIGNGLSGYIREDFERGFSSVVSVQGTEQRVNGVATVGRTRASRWKTYAHLRPPARSPTSWRSPPKCVARGRRRTAARTPP